MTLKNYVKKNPGVVSKSFLGKNPNLIQVCKDLMIEAEDLGLSDTQLAIYIVTEVKEFKNKSHNTVRRYFKDIRLGLYD